MNPLHSLASAWDWNPVVAAGCLSLLLIYTVALRFRFSKRSILFLLGVVLLFIAMASPLNVLARTYLFTAHAVQDLILLQMAPALLVLGIPEAAIDRILKRAPAIAWTLKNPVAGWSAGVAAMVAWHIPSLFNAALMNPRTAAAQHASFLLAGVWFWWPVIGPRKSDRLIAVPWSALYLIAACVPCSLLGIALSFTHVGEYLPYFNPQDALGILPLIRDTWVLSPEVDQQTGGIFLWVGGCMVYTSAVMGLFVGWYNSPEVRDEWVSKVGGS